MKGKVTWKPIGLSAKRWREAAQMRGRPGSRPAPRPTKRELPGNKWFKQAVNK